MQYLTTTPFGARPISATLMKHVEAAKAAAPLPHINKWEIFRELCAGRAAFGLSDRDLTVLNALLTFQPGDNLSDNDNLVVFPSNRSLSERAHGMAESTLRRHIAALVRAGVILRHDSPNGKRYASRGADGTVERAFGFDLRPLLVKSKAISEAATAAREVIAHTKRLREELSLMKRDALKLLEYGFEAAPDAPWEALEAELLDIHREMRRKLAVDNLEALRPRLTAMLSRIRYFLLDSEKISGNDAQTERHQSNSKPDSLDSELCRERTKAEPVPPAPSDPSMESDQQPPHAPNPPNIPLAVVLKACPDILPYADREIRAWRDLVVVASTVRAMMGISPDAWAEAQADMGPEVAATTLAAILQRIDHIKSPGGYLRSLSRKAAEGSFSPGPMVMALLRA